MNKFIKSLTIISLVLLKPTFAAVPPDNEDNARYQQDIQVRVTGINMVRPVFGLSSLSISRELCQAAREYAESIVKDGSEKYKNTRKSVLLQQARDAGYQGDAIQEYVGVEYIAKGASSVSEEGDRNELFSLIWNSELQEIGIGSAWQYVNDRLEMALVILGGTGINGKAVGTPTFETINRAFPDFPFSEDGLLPRFDLIESLQGNSWDGYTLTFTKTYHAIKNHTVHLSVDRKNFNKKVGASFNFKLESTVPVQEFYVVGKLPKGIKATHIGNQLILKGKFREKKKATIRAVGIYEDFSGEEVATPSARLKFQIK